jgi:hypothetical protein
LAEDLRARDDAGLADVLRARPDLLSPLPADISSLAARASTRASVQRAVDRLARPTLQVLEVLCAVDEPLDVVDLARAAGATPGDVAGHVAALRRHALVWGPDRALRPVRAAEEVLGPHPAGLGPRLADALGTRSPARLAALGEDLGLPQSGDPAADVAALARHLRDPKAVSRLLEEAPPAARGLVERLAAGPPVGSVDRAERPVRTATAASPVEWLLARGLLVAVGSDRVALPREVGVALRGGRVHGGLATEPPALRTTDRRPEHVEAAAAGQAAEAVRLTEELAESWSATPAPVLRAGGLGVRELRRVADTLDVDAAQAAFVVELAWACGLVAQDGAADACWAPTPAYDAWRADGTAARWAALATGWLATSRVSGLVGQRDGRGAVRPALASDSDRPSAALVRRDVLAELAALPPGQAPDAGTLGERLAWRAPRRPEGLTRQLTEWTLREAAWLGVTGLGALAAPGRALAGARPIADVESALAAALPAPVDHVLLQGDLTAVAPGPLVPGLAGELALAADVDSRGGATVYRFTPESVRRALDAGRSAADVLRTLAEHSRTPVPQPLEYLVTDVARRHGRVRVGAASAYLRADDESLLAEVLGDRRAAVLRLRRLAPTVLSAQADPATVLDTLRGMGLAPGAEGADGTLVVRRPDSCRTPVRERPRPVTGLPAVPVDDLAEVVVAALRAGDASAEERARHAAREADVPEIPVLEPAMSLASLREAAAARSPVWVGLADPVGGTARRRVEPIGVDGGRVTVLDTALGEVRTLSVHRITGVAPVPDGDAVRSSGASRPGAGEA